VSSHVTLLVASCRNDSCRGRKWFLSLWYILRRFLSNNCFVKNALLMWKASSSIVKYQSQMKFKSYEKWLLERLIPTYNSVVVTENAPCQNFLLDEHILVVRTEEMWTSWTSTAYRVLMTCVCVWQLCRLTKVHKRRAQKFLADHILSPYGHRVSPPSTLPPRSQHDRDNMVTSWAEGSIKKLYF
jgi:hypothetical protein